MYYIFFYDVILLIEDGLNHTIICMQDNVLRPTQPHLTCKIPEWITKFYLQKLGKEKCTEQCKFHHHIYSTSSYERSIFTLNSKRYLYAYKFVINCHNVSSWNLKNRTNLADIFDTYRLILLE